MPIRSIHHTSYIIKHKALIHTIHYNTISISIHTTYYSVLYRKTGGVCLNLGTIRKGVSSPPFFVTPIERGGPLFFIFKTSRQAPYFLFLKLILNLPQHLPQQLPQDLPQKQGGVGKI